MLRARRLQACFRQRSQAGDRSRRSVPGGEDHHERRPHSPGTRRPRRPERHVAADPPDGDGGTAAASMGATGADRRGGDRRGRTRRRNGRRGGPVERRPVVGLVDDTPRGRDSADPGRRRDGADPGRRRDSADTPGRRHRAHPARGRDGPDPSGRARWTGCLRRRRGPGSARRAHPADSADRRDGTHPARGRNGAHPADGCTHASRRDTGVLTRDRRRAVPLVGGARRVGRDQVAASTARSRRAG